MAFLLCVCDQSDINERRLAILFDNKPNTYMCGFAFTVAFSNDDGRHIQGSFAAQVNSFTSLSSIKLGLGYVLDFTAYLSYPIEPFPAAVDSKGQYVTGSVLMQFKMEYKEHIARSIGGNMHADDVSVNSLGRTHGFRAFGSEHWIGTSVKCPSEEVENMFRSGPCCMFPFKPFTPMP